MPPNDTDATGTPDEPPPDGPFTGLTDAEIAQILKGDDHKIGTPPGPQQVALAIPFPLSINDAHSINMLATNYLALRMASPPLSVEGAHMMAVHCLNAFRVAAGIEASLTRPPA